MGSLFSVPKRPNKEQDKKLAKKSATARKAPVKKGNDIASRIANIRASVDEIFNQYADDYILIRDVDTLQAYLDESTKQGTLAIDTETTGLNPLADEIVGASIYTPTQKAAYIPINHVSYVTGVRVADQLSAKEVGDVFRTFFAEYHPLVIMFNAKFDMRFIKNRLGVDNIYCDWDCYLASRLMNENEGAGNHGLKALYKKYVQRGKGDAFSFDALFKDITFNLIPINVGYLYAAHDAIITHELYEFQKPYLTPGDDLCTEYELKDVAWVFHNIEMPCIPVVAEMEDTGIELDLEYAQELSEKYTAELEEITDSFYEYLQMYEDDIAKFRRVHPDTKLGDPINIGSPTQIAILLYDVFGEESVDKKAPRGTGEDILRKMDNPICKIILRYREVTKLLGTYIDKLPECVGKDNRIHCSFNQYGADTGRFSSSDPNLQNIPSHNKDIRKMFVATNEEKLVSTDTQQFVVDRWCEVECQDGWKCADSLVSEDVLLLDDGSAVNVIHVDVQKTKVVIDFT